MGDGRLRARGGGLGVKERGGLWARMLGRVLDGRVPVRCVDGLRLALGRHRAQPEARGAWLGREEKGSRAIVWGCRGRELHAVPA